MELTEAFKNISKRECGFVVRRRFPNVKRVQSNHVYYYAGIRRVNNVENLPQTSMITEGILLLIYHNRILTLIF